jgi:hypothetical protein
MSHRWSRRSFVELSALSALGVSAFTTKAWGQPAVPGAQREGGAPPPRPYAISGADAFPQQDPSIVKEAVTASHGNVARIRDLVEKQPALARASIDWGFGDWETCIDAAAHVGNKPIAEFLLANGARPTIFSAAMMGQLDVVKAFIAARPGIQKIYGPHGITLMAHAKAGGAGAAAVVQYLATVGDADVPLPSQPLPTADRDPLVGQYVFGPGPRDFFTVDIQQDRLGIDRPAGPTRRNLVHLGDLVFFPIGVPTAKIAFARENGKVTRLTLADPNVMVTAIRQ